jgi:aspartate/methionine/tyrosine aminotransferase
VVFLNNASFPTGWVASAEEWDAVAALCREHDLWLLYWGGFEAVLYDGRPVIHPAALPGMRDRTVIVGAPSSEQRMIAWRVGWVVMPAQLTDLVARAQIYNGLVASGFAQIGTRVALDAGDDDVAVATAEWERRRDETVRQLDGLPAVSPHGAWAVLLDAQALGIDPAELSRRLLEHKVAATPMGGWGGEVAARHLRFVFSNEPVERLALLGERVRTALAQS